MNDSDFIAIKCDQDQVDILTLVLDDCALSQQVKN